MTNFDEGNQSAETSSTDPLGATQLTNIGWEQNGQQLGMWTNQSNVVLDLVSGIEVADNVTVNTLAGNDLIKGLVSSGIGLLNQGTIITGSGNDSLQGRIIGEGNDNIGIFNDFQNDEDVFEIINTIGTDEAQQIIKTEVGADQIIGTVKIKGDGSFNNGILSGFFGSIDTGEDNDSIIGTVAVAGNGDFNQGVLFGDGFELRTSSVNTSGGEDQIIGAVEVAGVGNSNTGLTNVSFSTVDTGTGDDRLIGTAVIRGNGDGNTGIVNAEGSINTGNDEDKIIGTVKIKGNGDLNRGIVSGLGGIDLGTGDDYLYGAVEVQREGSDNNIGIYNDFANIIRMGAGDDLIVGVGGDAYTGFGADFDDYGSIDLGEGNDRLVGFGANQFVDGGSGKDLAKFEFNLDESVTLGSDDANSIDITANEKTMSFTNVEEFAFANDSFTFDELIDFV